MTKIIVFSIIIFLELLGLLGVIINWKNDCKEYGKEDLAVSLKERIITYIIWIIFPSIIGMLGGISH